MFKRKAHWFGAAGGATPDHHGQSPHLLVSFAPYTPLLAPLKGIGQLFPGPRKTTRTNTLREDGIVAAASIRPSFYFSRLIAFERG